MARFVKTRDEIRAYGPKGARLGSGALLAGLLGLGIVGGCDRNEPNAARVEEPRRDASKSPELARTSPEGGGTAEAAESADARPAEPDDADELGKLEQTDEHPDPKGPHVERMGENLFAAIQTGEVERAAGVFFPVSAYAQVKDVGNPARDWRYRLMANFKRDVETLHKEHARWLSRAEFVRFEIDDARAKWMKPGSEYNKIGYFRVLRSRLVLRSGDKERAIPVTSLISWRGRWFVVHLTGFK